MRPATLLATALVALPLALTAPIPAAKAAAQGYGTYGDYAAPPAPDGGYGTYGSYDGAPVPAPPPPPSGGYTTYGSYDGAAPPPGTPAPPPDTGYGTYGDYPDTYATYGAYKRVRDLIKKWFS